VRREAERGYKEGKEEGFGEVEEGVLMGAGEGDSFRARWVVLFSFLSSCLLWR
jgi:hypothetical protein